MSRSFPRKAQASAVIVLGVAVAWLAAPVWIHRVELVQVPWLWRQARLLEALRASQPEHPAFAPPSPRVPPPRASLPAAAGGQDWCPGPSIERS